jgi:hypothetical protein
VPNIADDRRLDLRVKWALRNVPVTQLGDVDSRETLLEISNSPKALELRAKVEALYEQFDTEDVAPSDGLTITTHDVVSAPDGNTILIRFVRPDGDVALPCVYYIHGGGMQNSSCFDAMYRVWARVLAAQGVAVAMVDFRNAVTPSSVPEVEPFPAGLNDCVSGLKWVAANRRTLAAGPLPVLGRERGHPAQPAPQSRSDRVRHRTARGWEPARMAVVRDRRRRRRAPANVHHRQRSRPVARRGCRVLSTPARGRRRGAVPSRHGHEPRHGRVHGGSARHQPRDRGEHRPIRDPMALRPLTFPAVAAVVQRNSSVRCQNVPSK